MSDKQFVDGLYPKPRHPNQPDFVIGKLSIKVEQFSEWVRQWKRDNPGEEWINIEMTTQKKDPRKGTATLDTWKPEPQPEQQSQPQTVPVDDPDEDLPF
jgi:hypothetical protein